MLRKRRGLTTVALVAGLALTAAACGGSGDSAGTGTGNKDGDPVKGGTLKMLGGGDIDHMDPAAAYYTVSYTLLRGITRQLVSYPLSEDQEKADTPVPDLATDEPEISSDGKTYTMTIRDGAQWDTTPPRQITGADAARGFKRLCNPVQPTGAIGYFVGVIAGMKEFCDPFAKVPATIPAIKDYIEKHEISGIKAEGNKVSISLVQPAGDFVNILAMPFSTPAPVEVLDYLPDSPQYRQHFVSSGPYKITKYVAEKNIELTRNPAWKAESDPLRKAYVDNISIVQGSDEGPVQQQLEAGTVDASWDTFVPTAQIPALVAKKDANLTFVGGGRLDYVTINSLSPNAGGALKKLEVRQAINYATNKKALIQVLGGPTLFEPTGNVLTPPITGYKKIDLYQTDGSAGNPAKAKELLKAAGYANGLDLIFIYRNKGKAPALAATMQAELAKAGIRLKLKQVPPADFYTQHLQKPSATKAGDWDLALPGWAPDWSGNAARSFFVPLLDGRNCGEGSTNYNCYNSEAVNKLIDQALAESDIDKAADLWAQADETVMKDAPWVPISVGKSARYHGSRVKNATTFRFAENIDISNVWLKQ
jgi:peptide/nickel transport system substrate-binding protein